MTKECEFLREYEKLCQKYGMGLIGCGCCGSPYLNDIDDINYNKKLNKIFINGSGFWHEKYQCVEECEPNDIEYYNEEKTLDEYFK